ncbi:hypothetical protein, partial [Pseudogemmobacter bohemicus]|uniref:hypothetical protein n=1 Tax=Pseudogemmobacter bohemicus TaxID=2250708 RepID=UPI001E5C18E2
FFRGSHKFFAELCENPTKQGDYNAKKFASAWRFRRPEVAIRKNIAQTTLNDGRKISHLA